MREMIGSAAATRANAAICAGKFRHVDLRNELMQFPYREIAIIIQVVLLRSLGLDTSFLCHLTSLKSSALI